MSRHDGATMWMVAYLIRETCGLEDRETVSLEIGAGSVREMALRAKDEVLELRAEVRKLRAEKGTEQ